MIFSIIVTISAFVLAAWGLFHQLIVGGAIGNFKNINESEGRIVVMSWVAQGGFMSFTGILTGLLLILHEPTDPVAKLVCILTGLALLFLALHIFLTGYTKHLRPVKIGGVLQLVHGILLLLLAFFPALF